MSFPSAVAGPSRLPYVALRSARGYATARRSRGASDEPTEGASESRDSFRRAKTLSYPEWLNSEGVQYRHAKKGEKAKWFGGAFPFPNNPSFRPPPPLSNELQNKIYAELRAGQRTVGAISQQFSVSKARVEAIRKLKQVEEEFRRQKLPLQEAFQENMESLLGAVPKNYNGETNLEARRADEERRITHTSTTAELDEEIQKEQHLSVGGAFGDLRLESRLQGLEKDAWEFQDEATVLSKKHAKEEAEAAPRAEKAEEPVVAEPVSTTAKPGKTLYRFIDTSKKVAS